METINERLAALPDLLKYDTPAALAKACGIDPNTLRKAMSGPSKPSFDVLEALTKKHPKLSLEWLLLGQGEALKNSAPATQSNAPAEPAAVVPPLPSVETKKLVPLAEGQMFISHSIERMLAGMTPEQQATFWRGMFEEEVQRNRVSESDLLDRLTRKTIASPGAAAPQPFIESVVTTPTTRLIGPRFDEPVVLDFYTGQRKAA